MAENLKVTHYNDGSEIQYVQQESSEPDVWGNLSTGAYGYKNDDQDHLDTYGNLYNWYVVDDDRGVCPEGFHVPLDEEWMILTDYLGGTSEGGKMKEAGYEHWNYFSDEITEETTNESGFTGLPAGYRYYGNGSYYPLGDAAYFWSSSEYSSDKALCRKLYFTHSGIGRLGLSKQNGYSIRCLEGEITTGCTNPEACNYDETATADDGSCIYPDNHYDCNGNCLVELDCAGNCCVIGEEGCYWQETGPCGEEGPSDGMDSCGVCGGDNSSCADCAGVPCSDAYVDNCGICDDIPENDCVQDCAGVWGGNLEIDECGVCGGDNTSCQQLGDINGDGTINVIDIVMAVDLILSNNYDAVGDVNEDGLLNVIDIVMIVDWVLNGTGCSDESSWDYDMDGICDADDTDDDNDNALDPDDSDDNNEYVCSDIDGDNCDDCSSGTFDPTNDGIDMNGNGICDEGEANNDTDGDGVIDDEDSDPFNPYQCSDLDGDTCDDCSTGTFNPSDDGYDYDGDGQCDDGDCDDDNDGCQECWDYCP